MNIVHYRGIEIAIIPQGFKVGDITYSTVGQAKVAIAKSKNRHQLN